MDIISYGAAGKAAKQKKTTQTLLGSGVTGSYTNVKLRIDEIQKDVEAITSEADKLIVQDAINIMKANAKLNAIAKNMKYKMHNMVFDDLLDLSGIDVEKSSGYSHDELAGIISNGTIVTLPEIADSVPAKAILTTELTSTLSGGNVALGKPVTLISGSLRAGSLSQVTNGNISDNNLLDTSGGAEVQIDLGQVYNLNQIKSYHFSEDGRAYHDILLRVSVDGVNWITVFDSKVSGEYSEQYAGKVHLLDGMSVRYIREAMNGSTINGYNHWREIEAYEQSAGSASYSISRDGGTTWEPITADELFYFTVSVSPMDTDICLKMVLSDGTQLLNYALTWA